MPYQIHFLKSSKTKSIIIGVHPLYGEVADQIDLLEAAELSDEEDVEPSDVDNGDDVSDADVKHFDQKASIQSSKKFKEEKSKKCCSILLEKLVCLIETQQLNGMYLLNTLNLETVSSTSH